MSPLKFLAATLAAVFLLAAGAAAAFAAYGPERFWTDVFGEPDAGPFDFDHPTRSGKPNDALACPPPACTEAGEVLPTPLFPVAPETLAAEVRAAIAALPSARIVEETPGGLAFRAVVRTPLLRFPDTVSVEVRREPSGLASLRLHSRSLVGFHDLGTNAARLTALIDALAGRLPNRPPIVAPPLGDADAGRSSAVTRGS